MSIEKCYNNVLRCVLTCDYLKACDNFLFIDSRRQVIGCHSTDTYVCIISGNGRYLTRNLSASVV
jgi:hypothetical protein